MNKTNKTFFLIGSPAEVVNLQLITKIGNFPGGKINISLYTVIKTYRRKGIWCPGREPWVALFRLGVRKDL